MSRRREGASLKNEYDRYFDYIQNYKEQTGNDTVSLLYHTEKKVILKTCDIEGLNELIINFPVMFSKCTDLEIHFGDGIHEEHGLGGHMDHLTSESFKYVPKLRSHTRSTLLKFDSPGVYKEFLELVSEDQGILDSLLKYVQVSNGLERLSVRVIPRGYMSFIDDEDFFVFLERHYEFLDRVIDYCQRSMSVGEYDFEFVDLIDPLLYPRGEDLAEMFLDLSPLLKPSRYSGSRGQRFHYKGLGMVQLSNEPLTESSVRSRNLDIIRLDLKDTWSEPSLYVNLIEDIKTINRAFEYSRRGPLGKKTVVYVKVEGCHSLVAEIPRNVIQDSIAPLQGTLVPSLWGHEILRICSDLREYFNEYEHLYV
jgi:hypothetical protein